MSCSHCSHCFGCVGLRNQSYCIFNQCYPKEEYHDLRQRIIAQMNDIRLNKGWPSYGEFFPYRLSLFPFNDSDAMLHLPLNREEAEHRGARWRDADSRSPAKGVSWDAVPQSIKDTDDSVLSQTFLCEKTKQAFRLTAFELSKYRQRGIPLPRVHWRERMLARQEMLNVPELYERHCKKTEQLIESSFPPESPWQVWETNAFEREVQGAS